MEKELRAGKTNQDTLDVVKRRFPEANTTLASVAWYRSKLRREGENVPTDRLASLKKR